MTECFDFKCGDTPLLVSIPHDGRAVAPGMADRMTAVGQSLPDTDWHVTQLYEFAANLGASIISANYSRYVVDLNRSSTNKALYVGQLSTGLCPIRTFSAADIYKRDQHPDSVEQQQRVSQYWQPYHQKIETELAALKNRFGYALLWDAHSIRSEVPELFDGTLPGLNVGSNGGSSCHSRLTDAVGAVAEASRYSVVINGRFKGGFITRNYGQPANRVHSIQLELTQRCYMDEETGEYDEAMAELLRKTLSGMLEAFLSSAEQHA